jgi:hypothetical protein
MALPDKCEGCLGSGEWPTDFGMIDCPECGGSGILPSRNVLVDWRSRDIERAVGAGHAASPEDVKWLLAELRTARVALTDIIALAHDAEDPEGIAVRIRFAANRALGLYETRALAAAKSTGAEKPRAS